MTDPVMLDRIALQFERCLNAFVNGHIDTKASAEAVLRQMFYVDGIDEDAAIAAGRRVGMDPAMVVEAFDAMIAATLGERS